MDAKELLALSALLDEALDLPDEPARARWLERLPPQHQALKPRLAEALAAHAARDSVLDRSLPMSGLLGHAVPAHRFEPGQIIGRYRLVRELGQGGMSVVWLAEVATAPASVETAAAHEAPEAPDAARVALKFPAISINSRAFLERFARERAFLTSLQHPGIAGLVEAGITEAGQHYIALQFVDGQPLDVYCDDQGLGLAARVRLLLQVLNAVAYAHSRSILHRDLKPSNILVCADGTVRLLDFGIAKLLVDGKADETELTEALGRALTPHFASPEQIAGGTVTAGSDVYALGVILYLLTCGNRPYHAHGASRQQLEAAVLDPRLDPAPPSECCRADAVVCRTEGGAKALSRQLSGDLDGIALKALHKDPSVRYANVATMATDLSRWLADEPVHSRLERGQFRLGLLWRRHRAAISLSALLMLAIGTVRYVHPLASGLETLLTPAVPEAQRPVLVTIGAAEHQRIFGGVSPLEPQALRSLVARIMAGHPAALGVDIDTASPTFLPLRQAFDAPTLGRIVWGRGIAASDDAGALPIPQSVVGAPAVAAPLRSGLAVSVVDSGSGTVRWFRRTVATSEGPMPSLPGELVRDLRPGRETGDPLELRGVRFAHAERLEVPASVVLADGFEWRDRIADRVVILGGRYDPADVHATPLGLMHGVDVLAHVVETELSGRAHPRPRLSAIFLIGVADLLAALWFFQRLRLALAAAASLGFGIALAASLAALGLFPAWSYALLVGVAVAANQWLLEWSRQRRLATLRALRALWRRLSGRSALKT